MRYHLRTLAETTSRPLHAALALRHRVVTHESHPLVNSAFNRLRAAALESMMRLIKDFPKQSFDYEPLELDGQILPVQESVVVNKPFCELRRFSTVRTENAPKLLFVAAMSGHHATLSKETLREFLPNFDVYITDWVDARLVPLSEGRFGLEEYIGYLMDFLEALGPDVHMIGLCQAAVPALCAAAIMAEDQHTCRPRTLSLLAGPIDVRVNPNAISKISERVPLAAMRLNIHKVPAKYPGAGRRVYPGYLQLINFISLNPGTHLKKHLQFFNDVSEGNQQAANKHRDFYDEYNAVMDSTAEFYLETLERIFFDQQLPKGTMQYKGRLVKCAEISDIALLTLEGEADDMVAIGVTGAAQDLCSNLPDTLREHHVQSGVGHYGVFNGSVFKEQIAPRMQAFMQRYGAGQRSD